MDGCVLIDSSAIASASVLCIICSKSQIILARMNVACKHSMNTFLDCGRGKFSIRVSVIHKYEI